MSDLNDIKVTVEDRTTTTVVDEHGQVTTISVQPISITIGDGVVTTVLEPSAIIAFDMRKGDKGDRGAPGIGGGDSVAVKVFTGDTQLAPSGTAYKVQFDTEAFDTDDIHDPTKPTKLTINNAGIYSINLRLSAAISGANPFPFGSYFKISILKNGVTEIADVSALLPTTASSTTVDTLELNVLQKLNATDFIEAVVTQTSGYNAAVQVGERQSHFSAVRECNQLNGGGGGGGGSSTGGLVVFQRETPLSQGEKIGASIKMASNANADYVTLRADMPPQNSQLTIGLYINGNFSGQSITLSPGEPYKEVNISILVPAESVVEWVVTECPTVLDDKPSMVYLFTRFI